MGGSKFSDLKEKFSEVRNFADLIELGLSFKNLKIFNFYYFPPF
jgi:hypothetical protein